MKLNELQKSVLLKAINDKIELSEKFKQSDETLKNLIFAASGQSGFTQVSIEGDELILTFPEKKEEIKTEVKE